jgi:hypothetical protein
MCPFQQGSAKFVNFTKALNINLVECSPTLQKVQYNTLRCEDEHDGDEKRTVSKLCGAPVYWHASLEQVPSGCMGVFHLLISCFLVSVCYITVDTIMCTSVRNFMFPFIIMYTKKLEEISIPDSDILVQNMLKVHNNVDQEL